MALYENVFIARQDVPATTVETLTTQFADLVTGLGGTVSKKEYWGLRSLAFRLIRHTAIHDLIRLAWAYEYPSRPCPTLRSLVPRGRE